MSSVANDTSWRQAERRGVNRRIRSVIDWADSDTIDVFCECGCSHCADRLRVRIDDFDDAVEFGRYLVASGHE